MDRARTRTGCTATGEHSLVVRAAQLTDAPAAVELLRESIARLCVDDHHDDTVTLERWLQNKTVDHLERWIADPRNFVAVAELGSTLAGIGLVNAAGKIHLCYVGPGQTGLGVGSAIIRRLEAEAVRWGLLELRLTSTVNARRFYEHHGYEPAGPASPAFGVLLEYPYRKALV